MTESGATATLQLALALALLSMPSQRRLLRRWPLPEDTLLLVQVAAGSPEALEVAVQATGESAERLMEAARFYLEEVMLFEGADAYRLLGLNPGAEATLVKQHYRQLQRWLHPDRSGHAVAPGYVARINAAWDQLRTAERRRAYDAGQQVSGQPVGTGIGSKVANTPVRWFEPGLETPADAAGPGLRFWWFGTLGACCLVLFGFALWQARLAPPEWLPDQGRASIAASPAGMMQEGLAKRDGDMQAVEPVTALLPLPQPLDESVPVALHVPVDDVADDLSAVQSTAPTVSMPVLAPYPEMGDHGLAGAVSVVADVPVSQVLSRAVKPLPPPPSLPTSAQESAAQARLQQVSGFLASPVAVPPPLWNDVATLDNASHQRAALYSTRRSSGARFGLHQPQWQISAEQARVVADYRLEGGRGLNEAGRLHMSLVWREDRWLVSGLQLEPGS